ncbi:DUF2608 domain-containing protein [Neochlamydia sp. AcF95]|uniref:DUF2608 domain-containing protein n=1 Tax=Neochlamydia sp. AcF95 TaxID=2795734 RepID=UPI001BC90297|nr:DUF2608 domain-containing protein [Neochlamydia sp. AcF95]MBS4171437.1 Uncharacterized protein [Neochlamydia sp. AcF95]
MASKLRQIMKGYFILRHQGRVWLALIGNFFLLVVAFLFSMPLSAKVVETHRFADILQEVDPHSIIFFDIDDTLINTTSILGNTPWWSYFVSKMATANLSKEEARLEVNKIIQKIMLQVPMRLIDPSAAEIIKKLQQQGILTFALTARCLNPDYMQEADLCAYKHLKSVGIDFSLNRLPKLIDSNSYKCFSQGIIFTDYQDKGPFLKNFLNHHSLRPSKVIFIDDSPRHMKSVESMVEAMGIPFCGFRYSQLDHFHKQFDPLLANIQLEAFLQNDRLLSDEEALKIAQAEPDKNPDYFINELMRKWQN